jgi:hypothetical protein
MSFQIQYISIIITYFVTKMQAFFSFLNYFSIFFCFLLFFQKKILLNYFFFFLVLDYFLPVFITISLFPIFFYFLIVIIVFIEHAYFMRNIWVLHKPSKRTNQHFMLQMWVLQNHSNKTNAYFVTFMQVFHIEFYVFEIILMQ